MSGAGCSVASGLGHAMETSRPGKMSVAQPKVVMPAAAAVACWAVSNRTRRPHGRLPPRRAGG